MVEIHFPQPSELFTLPAELLAPGEVIAVVDDSPEIVLLLSQHLKNHGFPVVRAGSAQDFSRLLATEKIALVLLDIGLPDRNGNELLAEIVPRYPDLGIIMVTGTTDIEVALDCLRQGADDFMTKPVNVGQFSHTIHSTLKKRRLTIQSRLFQEELQKSNARMRFLHHLNLKMNTAYLNTVELRGILRAILVGITAEDGLRFNRAFLALYNDQGTFLEGRLAIGPASREEAGRVWESIKEKGLQLDDILEAIQNQTLKEDIEVNRIIQSLQVPTGEHDHVLIHASRSKQPIRVEHGAAPGCRVPGELIDILGESSFAVVPLFSPGKSLGVMLVDNFVTGTRISAEDIGGLQIFASQASLAIEHSQLYAAMAEKINALEMVTEELERNKDLLVAAERTSAIGEMAAQLLHSIRNPLTSIGGASRLLNKKIQDPALTPMLAIITQESNKIEDALGDLLSFVDDRELVFSNRPIYPLIRQSLMVFYSAMKKNQVRYTLACEGLGPTVPVDENRIRTVLLQLIKNSLEAMVGGGELRLEGSEDANWVTITIIDSGPGIPAETLPHVKTPFFTTKTYGNGLGLALVEQIVAAHGGRFVIHDGLQGGTEARVILPKASAGTA
jgi:signal transduction histidine kinase/DNA-binding response OmpR family regulator